MCGVYTGAVPGVCGVCGVYTGAVPGVCSVCGVYTGVVSGVCGVCAGAVSGVCGVCVQVDDLWPASRHVELTSGVSRTLIVDCFSNRSPFPGHG